jgi:hypothetical protein
MPKTVSLVAGVVGPEVIGDLPISDPMTGLARTATMTWDGTRYVCTGFAIVLDPGWRPATERITTALVRQTVDRRETSVDGTARATVQSALRSGLIHEVPPPSRHYGTPWGLTLPMGLKGVQRVPWVRHLHALGAALHANPTEYVVARTGWSRPTVSRLLAAGAEQGRD